MYLGCRLLPIRVRGIFSYPPVKKRIISVSVYPSTVKVGLDGQHPQTPGEMITWLEAAIRGWNAAPTPFQWGGKRALRRQRSRSTAQGGGLLCVHTPSSPALQDGAGAMATSMPNDPLGMKQRYDMAETARNL